MIVIDQHALHERIIYEELRSRVAQGQVESQRLLVPEPVDLPAAEAAAVLEQVEVLAQLGLEVEPFGGDTVLVRSLPAMLPQRRARPAGPRPGRTPPDPSAAADAATDCWPSCCTWSPARRRSRRASRSSPPRSRPCSSAGTSSADSHHCPHGRPTALVFTRADLEKQFGRI